LHARQIAAALDARKHVFCEKPLCLNQEEFASLVNIHEKIPAEERPMVMVGFNRRFSPMAKELRRFFSSVNEPLLVTYRINAGFIPASHWTQDPEQGGGRIVGEICHFVDFCTFLAGSLVTSVIATALPNGNQYRDDNLSVILQYENGSVATITYAANGDKSLPKEKVEVFGGGCAAVLDDYKSLQLVKAGRSTNVRSRLRQDKGHLGEWQAFAHAIKNGETAPIGFEEILNTTLATFKIVESCRVQEPMKVAAAFEAADESGQQLG